MRILAVSDEEAKSLYDHYRPGKLAGYDLILSCGDLKKEYLEFLVTMSNVPLLYVHGNHDDGFAQRPPEGCECVDGKLYIYKGVRILGLGGSFKYREGTNMYTEADMKKRIRRLCFALWRHKGFDILLTHAPARGLGDLDTVAHRGFECFVGLLDRYKPRYFLHGHVHRSYGHNIPQVTLRGDTTIINACEYAVIDYDAPPAK